MKYLIPFAFLVLGLLLMFSGCVTKDSKDTGTSDEEQLTKSLDDLNKANADLDNDNTTISNDLDELSEEGIDDPDIVAIDNELKDLETTFQDDYSDPFADLQ